MERTVGLSSDRLQRTSERLVEDEFATREDYLIFLMTAVTYDWAAEFAAGRDTLDFGCGSGWGSARLASTARRVVGVDVDADAIAYARNRYRVPNLEFQLDSELDPVQQFDAVISIQVIEHVLDPPVYLEAAARALRPGGMLLLATPNRTTRLFKFQKPWNPWHLTEWDREGLRSLVSQSFADVEVFDMTGDVDEEVRRTRRIRWLTLPLTVPFVPAAIRRPGLAALSALRRSHGRWAGEASLDVRIVPSGSPSVNLLVKATNR
jgi:SAM-dependent methyltransferase